MKFNHFNRTGTGANRIAFSMLVALVIFTAGEAFSSPLKTLAPQLPKKPLKCIDVSRRWQLCGSGSKTHFTAGVGIRFNKIDPNGKIVASRTYEDCGKLASDNTLPAAIRKKAASQCRQNFYVADKKAAAARP